MVAGEPLESRPVLSEDRLKLVSRENEVMRADCPNILTAKDRQHRLLHPTCLRFSPDNFAWAAIGAEEADHSRFRTLTPQSPCQRRFVPTAVHFRSGTPLQLNSILLRHGQYCEHRGSERANRMLPSLRAPQACLAGQESPQYKAFRLEQGLPLSLERERK